VAVTAVRGEARALFHAALSSSDRVLVTGAGGWFGSTVGALLRGGPAASMYVTQNPRPVHDGTGYVDAVGWDVQAIAVFDPTVLIDCAFVLRDHIASMPLDRYVHINAALTSRLLRLAQLPHMRAVVSVSSGASVHPTDGSRRELDSDPYGVQKRLAELALLGLADEIDAAVMIARPWSLSGSLVTRPDRYAFSDLLVQARSGEISIRADHEVWRRYVGVDDFFAVALAGAVRSSGVLNSGGELVEFGALAERICGTLGVDAVISRVPPSDDAPSDDYYSRDTSWDDACRSTGLEPADLDEQIIAVDRWFRASGG